MHFANVPKTLARDIPVGDVDADSFLSPSDNSFYLETPSIDIVLDSLKKSMKRKPLALTRSLVSC